jgi:F-type H+-transporting ATPase subunit b
MDILSKFGFNPMLFIAQFINFLIILFILKKLLYKPVLSMLKKRQDEIESGLKDAQESHKLLAEAEEKEKVMLQKAQAQSEKILTDAKNEALTLKAEIETNARKDADKLLEEARASIAQETRIAEEALTQRIGEISIKLLESSLKGIFGEKEQSMLLKKATEQINKNL